MKPDGIYVMNLTDAFKDGEFLRAYIRTSRETFKHVYLFTQGRLIEDAPRNTFVIVSSDRPLDLASIAELTEQNLGRKAVGQVYPDEKVQEYLDMGREFILTDDYVPVDNLLSLLLEND